MELAHAYRFAHDCLRRAGRVVAVAHPKPDGDTLGAAAAVIDFCRAAGIPADGFCVDAVPERYLFMPGTEHFTNDPAVFRNAAAVVVCDAGDLRFAGIDGILKALPVRPRVIDIDHHVVNEYFGDINMVDTSAVSTTDIVYDFFCEIGAEIDRGMAVCLLAGIFTDTGGFTNAATTPRAFETSADLLRRGAKFSEAASRIIRNKSIDAVRLWGAAFERLAFNPKYGLASTAIFAEDLSSAGPGDDDVDGISNFLHASLSVPAVLVLKESGSGKVKGSFRSAADIDVSALARLFGGGGHKKAAGFTVPGRIVRVGDHWRIE